MPEASGFLMDEPTWAQRVKSVRLKMGVTQIQLANELEMSEAGVVAWEMREGRPWSQESERFLILEAELAEQEDGGVS